MEKNIKVKTYVKKRICFDGFSLTGRKNGKFCATRHYACATEEDRLTGGKGIKYFDGNGTDVVFPTDGQIFNLAVFPYVQGEEWSYLAMVSTKNGVYGFEITKKKVVKLLSSDGKVDMQLSTDKTGVNYMSLTLRNSVWRYHLNHGTSKMLEGSYACVSCVYGHRLFVVTTGIRIQYSAPYDFYNFEDSADEGGYVDLVGGSGQIRQLIALEKEMYCFFDRQIFRVVGKGAARRFEVEKLPFEGTIVDGSAAAFGERVFFLTEDGFFAVESGEVSRIKVEKSSLDFIPVEKVSSAATEDCYFCTGEGVDGTKKTLTIIPSTGEASETYFAQVLTSAGGSVYGINESGRLFSYESNYPMPNGFVFERKGESFGSYREKTLKTLYLFGKGEVNVEIKSKYGAIQKTVGLRAEGTEIPVRLKGKTFDVALTLETGAYLTHLQAETVELQG